VGNKTKSNKNMEESVNDSVFSANTIKSEMPKNIEPSITETKVKRKIEEKPIPPPQKLPEFIYYLYFGDDESDFYTKTPPSIEGSKIKLFNVIQKNTLSEKVMGKDIVIDYNGTKDGTMDILTRELFGAAGFMFKCQDAETVDLSWIHKTMTDAAQELKDRKLSIYDQVVPEMYNKMNQIQRQQQQPIDEFDDYDTPPPPKNNRLMNW
jgi:hypothetical protein